jgi:hypothetical protein
VVTALTLLLVRPITRGCLVEIMAGAVFGFALQMKVIGTAYLPLAGLILWMRAKEAPGARRGGTQERAFSDCSKWILRSFIFGISVLVTFIALNCLKGSSLVIQVQQSWAAHFASARSYEYGSPTAYGFNWSILLKNWETTVPTLLGLCVLLPRFRRPGHRLPIAWLGLSFVVFGTHKPWWAYYYIHNALPLCWCAGVAIAFLWERWEIHSLQRQEESSSRPPKGRNFTGTGLRRYSGSGTWVIWQAGVISVLAISAAAWLAARIYLQEQALRGAPRLDTCLVLKEIERFKPFTKLIFSEQPIFSFHADLPMPPQLAVLSLKRFWTGEMTNSRLVAELETLKPGLVLLGRTSQQVPYQELLDRQYSLVYQDGGNRLYAHKSIARSPPL